MQNGMSPVMVESELKRIFQVTDIGPEIYTTDEYKRLVGE